MLLFLQDLLQGCYKCCRVVAVVVLLLLLVLVLVVAVVVVAVVLPTPTVHEVGSIIK